MHPALTACQSLSAYKQFILYKSVPSLARPGKTDKLPVSWQTQQVANAHDPAIWLPLEAACLNASVYGLGVGFVFTAQDPLWFLDIDEALINGVWSQTAAALCQQFPGAYVEVSQSGRGLHIIGSGAVPPHGSRNSAHQLEFYSEGRFVALTGSQATGDARSDHTAAVAALTAQWFPPNAADASDPAEWTVEPSAEWNGPTDDDELIRRMLASSSASAAFGGRPSPKQLWDADVDVLSAAFPDSGERPYDASRADSALAAHLAFWTGRNCGRIERLMLRSALARDKWDREAYLRGTIARAVALTSRVYTGAQQQPEAPATAPATRDTDVLPSDLARHFEGCVYIEDRYQAAAPDGSILTPQQFRASTRYGGVKLAIHDNARPTTNAWEAFTESSVFTPPMAHSVCFRPEHPSRALIAEGDRVLYNNYVPAVVDARPGDVTPFLTHLRKLLPSKRDADILLAWMSSAVQNPGVKFQWSPMIQGVQGNGKTFLFECLTYAIGQKYVHAPNAQDLSNKFNSWLDCKLLVTVEEIHVSERRDLLDTLKVLITNRRVEIQAKGANQVTGDNRANFILSTNYRDAIPKTDDDRRYAVFFTAQQEASDIARDGMGGGYFPTLYRWARENGGLAHVAHFLRNYQIPVELDPAGDCHRAPATSTTEEAIASSRAPIEQAVIEAIAGEEVGFKGGWVSSHYLQLLMRERRANIHPNQWDKLLQAIGYVKHPALNGGRVNNPVAPEGKKSRLWVRKDSIPALNLHTPTSVSQAYTVANSGLDTAVRVANG